ncbi:MAG: hypothetical protein IPL01_09215 [Acidobacteria bacterium]|nr:hypothetical protein [Acidobacteriota bacterium]
MNRRSFLALGAGSTARYQSHHFCRNLAFFSPFSCPAIQKAQSPATFGNVGDDESNANP